MYDFTLLLLFMFRLFLALATVLFNLSKSGTFACLPFSFVSLVSLLGIVVKTHLCEMLLGLYKVIELECNVSGSVTIRYQYMLPVTKYDRHGYKPRPRVLVVTKESLYLLDGRNLKIKQQISLDNLKGIYVSNYADGFAILNLLCMSKKEKGDLIIDCQQYIVEFVVKLVMACKNKGLLRVVDTGCIPHEMFGGRQGVVNFCHGSAGSVARAKDGSLKVTLPVS